MSLDTAPGERHREDERIERRVVEPFADEPVGREQASRRRRVESLERVGQLARVGPFGVRFKTDGSGLTVILPW